MGQRGVGQKNIIGLGLGAFELAPRGDALPCNCCLDTSTRFLPLLASIARVTKCFHLKRAMASSDREPLALLVLGTLFFCKESARIPNTHCAVCEMFLACI